MNNNITKQTNKQDSLEAYLDAWYRNKIAKNVFNQEDSNVLYLISGQGGGSRAGTWFLFNMGKFESLDKNFYEKIFSISAVSGSISGANMYLAAKNFQVFPKVFADSSFHHDEQTKELNHLKAFAKIIYGTNYISSGILGFTLTDYFIDGFRYYAEKKERDRNYYFQNEEIHSFCKYLDYYYHSNNIPTRV